MPTVGEMVRRLLPSPGSRAWPTLPSWPPDLFCVSASLVQASGLYAHPRYMAQWRQGQFFGRGYEASVRAIGGAWRRNELTNKARYTLLRAWKMLEKQQSDLISRTAYTRQPWWDAALYLMGVADEASKRIGFGRAVEFPHASHVLRAYEQLFAAGRRRPALRVPYTMANKVPAEEVCVLPKARTPQVGFTLRSLSHHLALVPPLGELRCIWLPGNSTDPTDDTFNLLLVPYPYYIGDDAFRVSCEGRDGRDGFFSLRQTWRKSPAAITRFLKELIKEARAKGQSVDGLVLPETALSRDDAAFVAVALKGEGLELFVSGVLEEGRSGALNAAFVVPRVGGEIPYVIEQAKHHRWKLTPEQTAWYELPLEASKSWWEQIDIGHRTCAFHVFRNGACLVTLICEDLARIEPVQTAIRAVGPNLVLALLMDGEQLADRWSARYATILGDDPGSSVVTLTCVGMIRRGKSRSRPGKWAIGLWRDPTQRAQELTLPEGHHALLLRLKTTSVQEHTTDGRCDDGAAVEMQLDKVDYLAHPDPPGWALT
jgi:hypothetical protein